MPSIPHRPLYLLVPEQRQQPERHCIKGKNCNDCIDIDASTASSSSVVVHASSTRMRNIALAKDSDSDEMWSDNRTESKQKQLAMQPAMQPSEDNCSETTSAPVSPEEEESSTGDDDGDNSSPAFKNSETKSADAMATQQEQKKIKKSVRFTALSTMYVFEDENYYDITKTWYSRQDLKSFRADSFLTVNWMVINGIGDETGVVVGSTGDDAEQQRAQQKRMQEQEYYSNREDYNRGRELNAAARDVDYVFCERGVECRTPMGRMLKNKRRLNAMRVVMMYQQMQKQHRRERRRELRRQQQRQHQRQYHKMLRSERLRQQEEFQQNLEKSRWIDMDIDADALATVYGSYCKESRSVATLRGQKDAVAAGMSPEQLPPPTNDATAATTITTKLSDTVSVASTMATTTAGAASIVDCPSLFVEDECENDCDEDDEVLEKLITLSYIKHEKEDESDTSNNNNQEQAIEASVDYDDEVSVSSSCASSISSSSSFGSTSSFSVAISVRSQTSCGDNNNNNNASVLDEDSSVASESSLSVTALLQPEAEKQDGSNQVNVVVEVELIEDEDISIIDVRDKILRRELLQRQQSSSSHHRIYVSDDAEGDNGMAACHRGHTRRNSWPPLPPWKSPTFGACSASPAMAAPPSSSSFSNNMDLGELFFDVFTGQNWW